MRKYYINFYGTPLVFLLKFDCMHKRTHEISYIRGWGVENKNVNKLVDSNADNANMSFGGLLRKGKSNLSLLLHRVWQEFKYQL